MNMFEEDLDIDFNEILDHELPTSTLKRQNPEPSNRESIKRSKHIESEKNEDIKGPPPIECKLDEQVPKLNCDIKKKVFHFKKKTIPNAETNSDKISESNEISDYCNKDDLIGKSLEINTVEDVQLNTRNVDSDESKSQTLGLFERQESYNSTRRKFPGPAGLLPDRTNFETNSHHAFDISNSKGKEIFSQTSDTVFKSGPWEKMKKDFFPVSQALVCLPEKYTIQWIKSRVISKKLINQKAPFLAALVQKISRHSIQNPIVNIVLKDETGSIHGTVLHDLYEEYSNDLTVGSVIILKEIGVLNIGSTDEPSLTITPNNLISIYTKSSNTQTSEDDVRKIIIQNVTASDISNNIDKLKRLHKRQREVINCKAEVVPRKRFEEQKSQSKIIDDFTRAMYKSRKQQNHQRPNLNNLKSNLISTSKSDSFKVNSVKDCLTSRSSIENSCNRTSFVSETSDLMDIFNTQEDIDEFFKDEPNFCSTQIGDRIEKTVNENSANGNFKGGEFSCGSICNEFTSKVSSGNKGNNLLENIFEGVDANSFFDDF